MTSRIDPQAGHATFDIMIDVDDVIVPWFETVNQRCIERFGYDGSRGVCNVWAMHEFYGVPREEWEAIVISATQDGLYTSTEPLPYSVEAMNRMKFQGHRLHVVTARGFMANGDNIRRWTKEYLENFGIAHDTLTFAKDKAAAMDWLGVTFDYAIDDGVHNFVRLQEVGVNVWLQDAPHNREFDAGYRRVASLWEFANIVTGVKVRA